MAVIRKQRQSSLQEGRTSENTLLVVLQEDADILVSYTFERITTFKRTTM